MTTGADVESFTLTEGQDAAMNAFLEFVIDPIERVFVLSGYAGCGKSTLVRILLDRIPKIIQTAKLINPDQKNYAIELTATTNKAAESLSFLTGMDVSTIHSFLGLRVEKDPMTKESTLVPRSKDKKLGYLIFIDEASYIDSQLLHLIFTQTEDCKIVFIGDPAQLSPVKSTGTPVFDGNFPGAALTEVVRQAEGNPIIDLATQFRETVNTGQFFSFKPDGVHIQHMDTDAFTAAIEAEFNRPDWRYHDSKFLAWTNKCVINANKYIRNHVKGDPDFEPGDYAVCNAFISKERFTIKTDELVYISAIENNHARLGVDGKFFSIDGRAKFFMPNSIGDKNAALKHYRAKKDYQAVSEIENQWIDLRAAYACTINKSQGSTFDKVFIDLDDISRCNSGNQIARMLYVAVSRARHNVYLTGDLA